MLCMIIFTLCMYLYTKLFIFRVVMVCTNLSRFVNDKDDNDDRIGDWCEQVGKGLFMCKWCEPKKELSFKPGKVELLKHARREKHKESRPASQGLPKVTAVTVKEMFNNNVENDVKVKAENLAITLATLFARHDVPFSFADCLTQTLKRMIDDSKIVENLTLGSNKVSYVVNYGLGDEFRKKTIEEMKNSTAFGISLDESEVNKSSQLECVAKIATNEGTVELKHYNTLDIDYTNATTIASSLTDQLEEDGIDFRSKLIDVATDGCYTMTGSKGGVLKKLQELIPQMHHTGSCSAHNLANTMKHAVESYDPDLKMMLVDIYEDIGGSKTKGLKKMKEFKKSCYSRGFIPKPFKKFLDVRFRTFKTCTAPVLYNWDEMVFYYKNVKNDVRNPTDRQKRLIEMIVNREDKTHLSLLFVSAATLNLTDKIDFFEKNSANIDSVSDVIENIFIDQAKKIFATHELMIIDDTTNEVRNKSRYELADLDVDKVEQLPKKSIFIGNETTNYMKKLDLTPTSSRLEWFYKSVVKFHITTVQYLLKYFSRALKSPVMDSFSALNQKKQAHFMTPTKLKSLVSNYSKVVSNINSVDGMDMITGEIETYVCDEDIKVFDRDMEYVDYWTKVGSLTDGKDWRRYEILPKFAIAMSVKFISNSEVERTFSLMNNIHSNKSRNELSQDSLNSCLHIKSAVESKKNRVDCTRCRRKSDHCHCSSLEITGQLRAECKKARVKYDEYREIVNSEKVVQNEEMNKKREKVEAELKEKLEKKKVKIANRSNYFSNQLDPVYGKKKKVENVSKTKSREKEDPKKKSKEKVDPKTKPKEKKVDPKTKSRDSEDPKNDKNEKNKKRPITSSAIESVRSKVSKVSSKKS